MSVNGHQIINLGADGGVVGDGLVGVLVVEGWDIGGGNSGGSGEQLVHFQHL